MQLIFEDRQRRVIKNREEIRFSSFSSFHLVVLTARARSEKQISKEAADDEDLTVKIDDRIFPKWDETERLKDSPAAFSGGQLHNLSKTIYFLTFLRGKDHTIVLETDEPHNTATFEGLEIYTLDLDKNLNLKIEKQAEDGDRRPWITFALDDLPLTSITLSTTYSRRKWDSDDLKIIIDGKTYKNIFRTIKHFLWRFAGSLLPKILPTFTETETFAPNLPRGLHYIESHADRMPILHNVVIDFGKRPELPELEPIVRVPTADNPKWTGDFSDDPEDVLLARLIFGEARNQPREAKAGVAWTVKNRLRAQRAYWGFSFHEVIQKSGQYAAMDPRDDNFSKLIDPFNTNEPGADEAWYECYQVAQGVIEGTIEDPTEGAVFFHSVDYSQERFVTRDVPGAIFIKQIGDILFYRK